MALRKGLKHRLVQIIEPLEIEAVKRGLLRDPRGGPDKFGNWFAESADLKRFRENPPDSEEFH